MVVGTPFPDAVVEKVRIIAAVLAGPAGAKDVKHDAKRSAL